MEQKNGNNGKPALDQLLSVADVAELLGMSEGAIYRRVERKQLPVVRLGRTLRFRAEDLAEFLEASAIGVTK